MPHALPVSKLLFAGLMSLAHKANDARDLFLLAQMHRVALWVKRDHGADLAGLDHLHHAQQGCLRIGAAGRLTQGARHGRRKHHAPGLAQRARLVEQLRHAGQLVGGFVHAHQGHERAALAGQKADALFWRAVRWQFGFGKHQQQALGLGLLAGCRQQRIEVGNRHGVLSRAGCWGW